MVLIFLWLQKNLHTINPRKTNILFKNPLHPYTRALLAALPTPKGKKLENIKGQISPITQIIQGCKFHPRCNYATDICKNKIPHLNNNTACHLINNFLDLNNNE